MRIYDEAAYRKARDTIRHQPCHYCGKPPPSTVHHIRSVRMGGTNHPDNLIAACQSCNNRIARLESRNLTPPGGRTRWWGYARRQRNPRA